MKPCAATENCPRPRKSFTPAAWGARRAGATENAGFPREAFIAPERDPQAGTDLTSDRNTRLFHHRHRHRRRQDAGRRGADARAGGARPAHRRHEAGGRRHGEDAGGRVQRRRARVVSREQRAGGVRGRESLAADDAGVAAPRRARRRRRRSATNAIVAAHSPARRGVGPGAGRRRGRLARADFRPPRPWPTSRKNSRCR